MAETKYSSDVDDEYSYANHDFGAGGTFSFGGVTVAANRDHESEEEVLTSMNANEFQVVFSPKL